MAPLWKNDSASYALRMTKKIREKKKFEKKIWKKLTKVCTKFLKMFAVLIVIELLEYWPMWIFFFNSISPIPLCKFRRNCSKNLKSFHFISFSCFNCLRVRQPGQRASFSWFHSSVRVCLRVCVCESAIYI